MNRPAGDRESRVGREEPPLRGSRMARLYRRWDTPRSRFGDIVVLGFLLASASTAPSPTSASASGARHRSQSADQLGRVVRRAGRASPAPSCSPSALGIVLHLCRVHNVVALLTAIYVVGAIVPWTALFLIQSS